MEMNREQLKAAFDEAVADSLAQNMVCAEIAQRWKAIDQESQKVRKLAQALNERALYLQKALEVQGKIDKMKERPDANDII